MNNKLDFKTIWKLTLDNKKSLIYGQILIIIAIFISVPIPLMLPVLVDEVLLNKPALFVNSIDYLFGEGNAFYYISIVAFTVIILRILYFLFTAMITKVFTYISKYVTFCIRQKLISHLKTVSMNEYESIGSGAITSNLITDVNTLDNFIINSSSKFLSSFLVLICVAIIMMIIHPILGCMILIIQPIVMFLSKKISKDVKHLKANENQAIEEFQNDFTQNLELFGQIKASNKEEDFFNTSILKAKKIQQTSNEYNYKSIAYERFSFTIFLISFEILRASGLLLVAYSDLTIGMMFAMFGYIWFIMTPVQDIISIQYSYAIAKAALTRMNKILALNIETTGKNNLKFSNVGLNISIKNLNFSYIKDKTLLKNISLEIKSNEKIALIGASGSGKTTLAQVISGFYEKSSGYIYYDDMNIDKIDKKSLRSSIFLVLQMPILFNNTLKGKHLDMVSNIFGNYKHIVKLDLSNNNLQDFANRKKLLII